MTVAIYDVAIIGGGIGGSILASILARNGVKVALVEGSPHPRFAIGESTTPDSTFRMRLLASRFDVPEIAHLASHPAAASHISSASGVKRHFAFVYHREGKSVRPVECCQFPTLAPPLGPDVHLLRQDSDSYLFNTAVRYGAQPFFQRAHDVEFTEDGVLVTGTEGLAIEARYVVDAGGRFSLLAEKLDLRDTEPRFGTTTRSIFTHMVGVLPWDSLSAPRRETGVVLPFHQGTLHHLFDGGWMWVIPFDNHPGSTSGLCSVGINLDPRRHPLPEGLSAEEEFWSFIGRFPDLAAQLGHAHAVRPFVRTGRTQFSTRQTVGNRFCLLPHASDFVDPLFSSGLSVTASAIDALASRLLVAVQDGDFSAERFDYVGEWTKRSFDQFDTLVSTCYTSFSDFRVWNAFYRVWMAGNVVGGLTAAELWLRYKATGDKEVFKLLETPPFRGVGGADLPEMRILLARAAAEVHTWAAKEQDTDATVTAIYGHLADSGLFPRFWGMLDPANTVPSGRFHIVNIARLLAWGRFRAPEAMRGTLLVREAAYVAGEAGRLIAGQTYTAAHGLVRYLGDHRGSWNRDWLRSARTARASSAHRTTGN